jgi:hypothetical protein
MDGAGRNVALESLITLLLRVLKTRKDTIIPADIVKTAATSKGEVIPYSTAYCALTVESKAALKNRSLAFSFLFLTLRNSRKQMLDLFFRVRNEDLTMKSLSIPELHE